MRLCCAVHAGIVLSALLAGLAQGQELGLKLKPQTELIPYSAFEGEALPMFFEADRLEGQAGRYVEAWGDVTVRQRGATLRADRLFYVPPYEQLTASGHVRLDRQGDTLTGELVFLDLPNRAGFVEGASYQLRRLGGLVQGEGPPAPGLQPPPVWGDPNAAAPRRGVGEYAARGRAERVQLVDDGRYQVTRGTYTNCPIGDDDWYLRADRVDIDRERDVGVARNATFVFKDVPVMYTPWVDFPVTSRRKSGLLPPTIGHTSRSGWEVLQPVYWNIAPNLDDTFAPRWLSTRGILLDNEFRYLWPTLTGVLRAEYLRDDRQTDESRWAYLFQHQQSIGRGWNAALNFQRVSDPTYFKDLSDKIAFTSQTNLPREVTLRYDAGWWAFGALVQTFQTLQDPAAPPITPPYSRLPQLLLTASQQNLYGFDLGISAELVNFSSPTQISAVRQYYYPNITYPLRGSYYYLTPKIGLTYTRYGYTDNASGQADQVRTLPIYSLDSGLTFERDTSFGGSAFIQTLEPRLYYLYIPYRDQNALPVFDTGVADFNLATLFSENRFSGIDRINDANQISAVVMSRLLDPATGSEILRGVVGQRFYLAQQKVTLNDQVSPFNRSDLLAGLQGRIGGGWSTRLAIDYDINNSVTKRSELGVQYRPAPGKVLNAGYFYNSAYEGNPFRNVDLSAQWQLSSKLGAVARWSYSLEPDALLEALAGLEYNEACWAFRIYGHRFVTATNQYSNAIFFQFELSGLSRLGGGGADLLRTSVPGYSRVFQQPAAIAEQFPGQ